MDNPENWQDWEHNTQEALIAKLNQHFISKLSGLVESNTTFKFIVHNIVLNHRCKTGNKWIHFALAPVLCSENQCTGYRTYINVCPPHMYNDVKI